MKVSKIFERSESSARPPLSVRAVNRVARLVTLFGTSSPIRDIDGCFLQTAKGKWQVWFRIDLIRAFDLLSEDNKIDGFERHIKLVEELVGNEGRLEVLGFPVGYEERYRRFRLHELDEKNPIRNDPEWENARNQRVNELTTWLQETGDVESRAYIGISISPSTDNHLSADVLAQLPVEERYGVTYLQHSHLIPEAARWQLLLKSAWGGRVDPIDRDELDVLLSLINSPGQPQIIAPDHSVGNIGGRETELRHYGSCNYEGAAPGVLEFDYLGTKSYASFVPMVISSGRKYLPENDEEYAFCTDSAGRRLRISWRFRVWPGAELLNFARKTARRNLNHQNYLGENEGQMVDLDKPVGMSQEFYQHVLDDGLTIVGPVVLVVTGNSVRSVQQEVLIQANNLKNRVQLVIDAEEYQAQLYEHCRLGSSTYLDRFVQYLVPDAFARGMPFVTSAPRTQGPDLLGWVRGREGVPYTGGFDLATLLPGLNESPTALWCGPSGAGKTTSITDQTVALIERAGYVGFIFELLKDDTRRLLGETPLGIPVRTFTLEDHPGLLNPAGFATIPSQRVEFMSDFLKGCIGTFRWRDEFEDSLRKACKTAIREADKAGRMRPDLYRVVQLLDGVDLIGSLLEKVASDQKVAPVFFSDHYDQSLIDTMTQPGLNIIGQEHFSIPDRDNPVEYTPQNWLALAGLDIVSMLARKVAHDRGIRVVMATVEFWRTARLSGGATEASYIGRVGRSLNCVSGYDTQFPHDVDKSLTMQVTTNLAFSVKIPEEVENSLRMVGQEITTKAARMFMTMAMDPEDGTDINKGTHIVQLPTLETLRVQSLRMYLPEGRTTASDLPGMTPVSIPKEG